MLPWLATNVLLLLALFLATNEHELHESIRSELSRQALVFIRAIRGLKKTFEVISGFNQRLRQII